MKQNLLPVPGGPVIQESDPSWNVKASDASANVKSAELFGGIPEKPTVLENSSPEKVFQDGVGGVP